MSQISYGRPVDVSRDGHLSDALFDFTTISVGVLFAIVVGVLVWACLFHGRRHKAHYDHGVGLRHLLLTLAITAVTLVTVDGTLLLRSYTDLRDAFWKWPTRADHPLRIEVLAQQWAWNIRDPGPDDQFNTPDDIVTLNELHVPVGRPVLVKLRAKDVIHSFYLPNFRLKQDAIPGTTTQLWFLATSTGTYEIGCAQHCGASHYKMHGLIHIESAADHSAWRKEAERDAEDRYDAEDLSAHWGWSWQL